MRVLPPIVAALLATSAQAATVRVVPWRVAGVPEAHVSGLVRATEAAVRELSTLVIQLAIPAAPLHRRCGAEDPACWTTLASRAGADYGLVLVADPGGGLTVDLVLVDLKARRVAQRRFTAPGLDGAAQGVRAALEALVPPFLRRGYGGFLVDLPPGGRLKIDGKVVLTEPSRAPLAVPSGRHEVDLLLPDGRAMLRRATVAEGQTSALALDLRPPAAARRSNDALRTTSAALWAAGTAALTTSFALAFVGNEYTKRLRPCATANDPCLTLDEANRTHAATQQLYDTANVLMIGGGVLAAGGAVVFTFDLAQGGGWQ